LPCCGCWFAGGSCLKSSVDCERAFGLLRGLLVHGMGDCSVPVSLHEAAKLGEQRDGDGELLIKDNTIAWRGAHQHTFEAIFRGCRTPFDVLLVAKKNKHENIYSHLLFGCGKAIDLSLDSRTLFRKALEVLAGAPVRKGRRADRALRDEIAELTGKGSARNAFRTSTVAKKLGLSVAHHKSWVDEGAQRKYLLACRRVFTDCISFGMTPDKARFAGRDWLGSSLFSPEVDQICWCAPQALREHRVV
jgi:hypothetical protein